MPTDLRRGCACLLALWATAAFGHGSAEGFTETANHDRHGTPAASATVHVHSDLILVASVETRRVVEHRAGIGRVAINASAIHTINAFISGQVREVPVRPGMHVNKGDPIARIYSPEFIRTQKAYLALLANERLKKKLRSEGRLPNYMEGARNNLRWWGMSDQEIERLGQTGKTVDFITVRAKADSMITEVLVQPGDLVNAGDRSMAKFVVTGRAIARALSDTESFWCEAFVFPKQLAGLRGEAVRLRMTLPNGQVLERSLRRLTPSMNTRRQLARIMVKLGRGHGLYLGQPLDFDLLVERPEPVWMPRAALMGHGLQEVVFIQTGPDAYQRRHVQPSAAVGEWVAVAGLEPGTQVVTVGKMMLAGAYRLARHREGDDHHDNHPH